MLGIQLLNSCSYLGIRVLDLMSFIQNQIVQLHLSKPVDLPPDHLIRHNEHTRFLQLLPLPVHKGVQFRHPPPGLRLPLLLDGQRTHNHEDLVLKSL